MSSLLRSSHVASLLLLTAIAGCVHATGLPDAGLVAVGRPVDAKLEVQFHEAKNGLRYALVPDPRTNVVTVDVRYTVGAADDPATRSGLAHFVEHLSFGLTAKDGGPTLAERLDDVAHSYNAYTNWDETHYTATALTGQLPALLGLEAERMAAVCDRISSAVFERERDVVQNEIRERGDDQTWLTMQEQLFGAAHPYAHQVAGKDVGVATREDACAFLTAHYAPKRAIVVITGAFDATAAQAMIEQQLGGLERPASEQRRLPSISLVGESVLPADIEKPMAIVAFPALAWGKTGNESRELAIDLWVRRAQWIGEDGNIVRVRRGYLGGFRGGIELVAVTAEDWNHLRGAVDTLFRARDELLADDFSLPRRDVRSRHVNGYLASLEQFDGMGIRVADYVQYADHSSFMLQPLNEAESLWPEGLVFRVREVNGYQTPRLVDYGGEAPGLWNAVGGLPTRAQVHVTWLKPQKGARKVQGSPPTTVQRSEVAEWRPPVDPAEATHPLQLPAATPPPSVEELMLPNGMRVVLAPLPSSPLLAASMVFPVGVLDEPASRPGLATMAANILDHDISAIHSERDFVSAFWALGLGTQLDADVSAASTTFRVGGAARYADWHLWRLFWLLDQGVYDEDALVRLRKSARESEDDGPSLDTVLARALVGPAAVRSPDAAAIQRVSGTELEAFRRAHYLPAGATLVVVGGFDPAAVKSEIDRLWGTWRGKPARTPEINVSPKPSAERRLAIDDDDAEQVTIALAFPASTPDMATRMVVAEMVAGQARSVRSRLGLSYGLRAEYTVLANAAPAMVVGGEVDPSRAGEAVLALLNVVDELRKDKAAFTRAFVLARRHVLSKVLVRVGDTPQIAGELESLARSGWTRNRVDALASEVANMKPDAAEAALARDLDAARMVTALSGPAAAVETAYQQAKLGAPRFVGNTPSAISAR